MNVEQIIIVLCAAFVVAGVVFFAYRGNKTVIMKMLYALVTEAERALGGGTGSLKLATVIAAIYPKLPGIIKMFVSDKTLSKWVDEALATAKDAWTKNVKLAEYIEPPSGNGESTNVAVNPE